MPNACANYATRCGGASTILCSLDYLKLAILCSLDYLKLAILCSLE